MAQSGVKLFITSESKALEEALSLRLNPDTRPEEPRPVDIRIPDFDDVHFRLEAMESDPHVLRLSLITPAWKDLQSASVEDHLRSVYGSRLVAPVDGANVTVQIDARTVGEADWRGVVSQFANIRRNVMAAPFVRAFEAVAANKGATTAPMMIRYRNSEPVYILPRADRVTVIYSLDFEDATDRAMARTIAQEFVESTRTVANAPPCGYTDRDREAPAELRGLTLPPNMKTDTFIGFLSFAIFPRHFDTPAKRDAAINQLIHFRTYLDYHIKAGKGYLHARMRARVEGWMQVLNRSHPEDPFTTKEKKLASGRTFINKSMSIGPGSSALASSSSSSGSTFGAGSSSAAGRS